MRFNKHVPGGRATLQPIPDLRKEAALEEWTEQTKAGGCERRGRNGKELCVLANRLQKEFLTKENREEKQLWGGFVRDIMGKTWRDRKRPGD